MSRETRKNGRRSQERTVLLPRRLWRNWHRRRFAIFDSPAKRVGGTRVDQAEMDPKSAILLREASTWGGLPESLGRVAREVGLAASRVCMDKARPRKGGRTRRSVSLSRTRARMLSMQRIHSSATSVSLRVVASLALCGWLHEPRREVIETAREKGGRRRRKENRATTSLVSLTTALVVAGRQKGNLPGRELNPGPTRDRRVY